MIPFPAPRGHTLTGTLPLRPFADRFFGTVSSGHASCRVAALACDSAGGVILLSVVGPDGACASALARLFDRVALTFSPPEEAAWEGPTDLRRTSGAMRRIQAALAGTRERHYLALAHAADICQILKHPTALPEMPPLAPAAGEADTATDASVPVAPHPTSPVFAPHPQFIFGNVTEAAPARTAFLGHLRGMRIIHIPAWADVLWERGLAADLILPLPALGIRAWQIVDHRAAWIALLTEGVKAGWLGTTSVTTTDLRHAA